MFVAATASVGLGLRLAGDAWGAATASVRANAWAAESSTLSYAPRLAEEDGAGDTSFFIY